MLDGTLTKALLTVFVADCDSEEHKYEVLVELYNLLTIGQSIIFVRVRSCFLLLLFQGLELTLQLFRDETLQTRLPTG